MVRLTECIPADDVLGFGKWSVGNGSSLPCHQLPGAFQRVSRILDVALLGQLFQPCHPPLHLLLGLLGRSGRARAAAIQVHEFAHDSLLSVAFNPYDVRMRRHWTIFLRRYVVLMVGY